MSFIHGIRISYFFLDVKPYLKLTIVTILVIFFVIYRFPAVDIVFYLIKKFLFGKNKNYMIKWKKENF